MTQTNTPEDNSYAIASQTAELHHQIKLHKANESIHAGNNAWNLAANLLQMGATLEGLGVTQEELQTYFVQSWILIVQAFRDGNYSRNDLWSSQAGLFDALDLNDFISMPPIPNFLGLIHCTPEEIAQFVNLFFPEDTAQNQESTPNASF